MSKKTSSLTLRNVPKTPTVSKKRPYTLYSPLTPWFFLAIPLFLYFFWVIFPLIQTMYYAFTKFDGISGAEFVGWKNFTRLFQDSIFHKSIVNNLKWLILFALIPIPVGFSIALLFDMKLPGSKIFKVILYLPMTLSFVIVGQIWSWIYLPDTGVISSLLRGLSLEGLDRGWLSDSEIATYSLIVAACWRQIPYIMVLYLAGLQSVPSELVESSMVDGANWFRRLFAIVIPLLLPATIISLSISIIDSLRAFDIVFIMTRGGPSYSSSVMANQMYLEAFNKYSMGYGASIAVIQFILTLGFIILYMRKVQKDEKGTWE